MLVLAPLPPSATEASIKALARSYEACTVGMSRLLAYGSSGKNYPQHAECYLGEWIGYSHGLRQLIKEAVEGRPNDSLYVFSGPGERFRSHKWEYDVMRIRESLPDSTYVIYGEPGNLALDRRFLSDLGGVPPVDSERAFFDWARAAGDERQRLFSVSF